MAATRIRSAIALLAMALILTPALADVLVSDPSLPRVPASSEATASALPDSAEVATFPAKSDGADEPLGARKLQQTSAFQIQIGGKAGGWVSCPLREIVPGIPVYWPSVCVTTASKAQATRFNAFAYKIKNTTWYAISPVNKTKSMCLTLYNTTGSSEAKVAPVVAYVDYCRSQSKNSTLPLPAAQLWASGRYDSKGKYTAVFEGHGYVLASTGRGKPIAGRYLCNPDKIEACIASVVEVS